MSTRRVLVCARRMPKFDREGGSRRIFRLLKFFQQQGWAVSFTAENAAGENRYARTLQQMGIATYAIQHAWAGGEDALIDFSQLIRHCQFDLVLFAFWTCAETYIPAVRTLSPDTKIMVDAIDIRFLRQSRRVFCEPARTGFPGALDSTYGDEIIRELSAYAASDAVLALSQREAELLNEFMGNERAHALPDAEDDSVSDVPLTERRGLLFVGNFEHPANVHAVEYLCREIVPRLGPRILAEHPVSVIGNAPNETVVNCCRGRQDVRLVGWVPAVLAYFQRARVSLAPLLHHAGVERSLMQSLMVGTPAVSTTMGIEGLDVQHDLQILVADDASVFADSVARLVNDAALWQRLAREGRDFTAARHGPPIIAGRFASILDQVL